MDGSRRKWPRSGGTGSRNTCARNWRPPESIRPSPCRPIHRSAKRISCSVWRGLIPKSQGVVGWVDLTAANIRDRLEYFAQFPKLKGFRHVAQSEPDDCFLIRDDFLRGIASLEAYGFTYDILIYPKQLPAAVELVRRFPRQPFVIDHLSKPFIKTGEIEPWATLIRSLAGCGNVYCKLSGLVTEANWTGWSSADFKPHLDVAFEAFGVQRLMFGSDWPVCLLAASYVQVKQLIAGLLRVQPRWIFGENASRFYGLTA